MSPPVRLTEKECLFTSCPGLSLRFDFAVPVAQLLQLLFLSFLTIAPFVAGGQYELLWLHTAESSGRSWARIATGGHLGETSLLKIGQASSSIQATRSKSNFSSLD